MAQPDLTADRARALALVAVSRETAARLDRFAALLLDWHSRMNLIAASTVPTLWTRHIADSLQLLAIAPQARKWADLGSGGGFPGVPIACALADRSSAEVHLIESNKKKAAFLREAVRVTGAPAVVHAERVADFARGFCGELDAVTARALAPLPELLSIAYPLLKRGAQGLFPKGQDVDVELTKATKCWSIQASLVPSRTDPKSRVVVIREAKPKRK
ncbi:MAG TPA: 16S rRNA (guanine(527)-N(7))-methyltransferase RsmG [Xanthobacteraceae bacterium]|nr:16S rRNA (guanine(527)-N(7))-methyltransferase RsmG [Xanthobacteraceae bacterium]